MKLDDIALQGCRNYDSALLAHIGISTRLWETGCLAQMELADILCIAD